MTPPAAFSAPTVPLTMSELLRLDPLAKVEVAHRSAADQPVQGVDLANSFTRLRRVPPHTLVVLSDEADSGGWSLATSLHLAWERAAAGVVISSRSLSASGSLLAERLDITLLVAERDPVDLALALAAQVSAPGSARALRIARCAEQLADQTAIRGIIAVLARELDPLPLALVAGSTLLAGRAAALADKPGTQLVKVPVTTATGHLFAELVTRIPAGAGDSGTVESLLALGRTPILAAWAQGRLQQAGRVELERVSFRMLRDAAAAPAAQDLPLAGGPTEPASWPGELGWQLDGINRAIWLTRSTPTAAPADGEQDEMTQLVHSLWHTVLPNWPLAPDEDGWVSWSTGSTDRPAVMRRAARSLSELLSRHGLVAGIGGAHPGARGLVRSREEARLTARVATTLAAGSIEWFDQIGVRAALGWLPIHSLEGVARLCLTDLLAAKDRRALISTVLAVLDNGGSLSVAAGTLGVHRNTVLARLTRARELGLAFDQPRVRLAVHTLCFALDTAWGHAAMEPDRTPPGRRELTR